MNGPSRPWFSNMEWRNYRPQQNYQWGFPNPPPSFRGPYSPINRPPPPVQSRNDNYWCETCDRGYPTEAILNKHIQEHQTCKIDGCQFVAHPKVITRHIHMQHSSGLYKKIANLKNPEEIEKWREERKKKYPTKSNIAIKAAELKEKIDRGEKMGLGKNKNHFDSPKSGYNNDNRQGQDFKQRKNMGNANQPRSKFRKDNNKDFRNKKAQNKPNKPWHLFKEGKRLKPFAGIQGLQMESHDEIEETTEVHDLIEDDHFEESKTIEVKLDNTNEPAVCVALSTLMCDYGSSEEEGIIAKGSNNINIDVKESEDMDDKRNENSLVLENPYQLLKTATHKNNSLEGVTTCSASINNEYTVPNQNIDTDGNDSGPDEVKIVGEKDDSTLSNSKPNDVVVSKNTVTVKKHGFKRIKPKIPSTLLHKLLSKEMQQERNIVLQCIRYIRRNNFFDKMEE